MTQDIRDFHTKFGQAYEGPPRELPGEHVQFRIRTLQEEVGEFEEAVTAQDKAQQLDALVDLVYFALGTAYLHGWDFDEAWRRVHAANMKKERAHTGNPGKRNEVKFDVVKPPGWTPPVLTDLVV